MTNGPLGEIAQLDFAVVRRGYDIDAVEAFLATQAAAWAAELRAAQGRIAELEAERHRYAGLEAELVSTRQELDHALENAGSTTEADRQRERQAAEAQAAGIIKDAEEAAARLLMDAEVQAEATVATRAEEQRKQYEHAHERHRAAIERLQETELALRSSVEHLNTTRLSLLQAFEAIAGGGLERLTMFDAELAELGIGMPPPPEQGAVVGNGSHGLEPQ